MKKQTVTITKKRTRLKPWAFWTFSLVFVFIISFCFMRLFIWKRDSQNIKALEKELTTIIQYEIINDPGTAVNPPVEEETPEEIITDYWNYMAMPFYDVDFTNLLAKNNDTVAFIHINNTNINYPVVQTTDNDYYLNHAFDKTYNSAGWVYMDFRNNFEPLSDNIVIYGHGRVDYTVFGSLKKALSKDWQSNPENLAINISTPKANYLYQIFSIYTIESENYYITTTFGSESEKQTWIDTMISRNTTESIIASANLNDKFLTLSTCYNNDGIRIVVQAKLIKISG